MIKINKAVELTGEVTNPDGTHVCTIYCKAYGDGSTPTYTVAGGGSRQILGYRDDGSVILSNNMNDLIDDGCAKIMAQAIKIAKELCVENGVDPDLVNIINAEKKVNNESTNE